MNPIRSLARRGIRSHSTNTPRSRAGRAGRGGRGNRGVLIRREVQLPRPIQYPTPIRGHISDIAPTIVNPLGAFAAGGVGSQDAKIGEMRAGQRDVAQEGQVMAPAPVIQAPTIANAQERLAFLLFHRTMLDPVTGMPDIRQISVCNSDQMFAIWKAMNVKERADYTMETKAMLNLKALQRGALGAEAEEGEEVEEDEKKKKEDEDADMEELFDFDGYAVVSDA